MRMLRALTPISPSYAYDGRLVAPTSLRTAIAIGGIK
jgi:hypothetical protein